MLVIRRLFGTGTNCIAPSGLSLLLCLFPGLAPWAFLSRPCGARFAPETRLDADGQGNDVFRPISNFKFEISNVSPASRSLTVGARTVPDPPGLEMTNDR